MRGEHYREVVVADILDFREQSQSFEDIAAWGLDSRGVVFNVRPFDQFVADAVAPRRFNLWLFSAFGFLAALLAAAGIYAIMDFRRGAAKARNRHQSGTRGTEECCNEVNPGRRRATIDPMQTLRNE